ncbi:MAG: ketopantoate reductase family protein [Anaerolineales bacterium]|nr:ketopantoate reductase family protein [Anaerolineales bacterium]
MQSIQKVIIVGAGAMGIVYAAHFQDSGLFDTAFLANGERYQRLTREGVYLNGKHYQIPALKPEQKGGQADLILIALKHHHLSRTLPEMDNIVGKHSVFISVMNGLDSERIIGERFGIEKLLYTIAVGIDAVRDGNQVTCSKPGILYFGQKDNNSTSEIVDRVKIAFDRAGIPSEIMEDMARKMWWKFMINVGVNQSSAILRAPYGVYQKSEEAISLMRSLMLEVIKLAQALKINLTTEDITEWIRFLSTLSPVGKTSMLQDIEAGRKTEVEIFGGKVIELGEELNIPTPVNRTVHQMIKVLESMYPGGSAMP